MAEKLVLEVDNHRSELDRITAAVEELGEREQWQPALVFKIHLALEELVVNVMTHGRHDTMHEIRVTLTSDDEGVSVEILDDGLPFNPLNDAPEPDLSGQIEDRRVGGLGVFLVLDMADEVNYAREHGKNCFSMRVLRDG